MNLQEKINILTAAQSGKTIQVRNTYRRRGLDSSWVDCADWVDMIHQESNAFNFAVYDYRVKPEPREFFVELTPDGSMIHSGFWPGYSPIRPGNTRIKVREVLD